MSGPFFHKWKLRTTGSRYRKFQVGCPKYSEYKTAKVSHDLNPPIESKLSCDNLDSIGGFKSCDTFTVLHSEFGRSKQPEKHGTTHR